MLINVRSFGFPSTDAILRYVEARIESALGPFARRLLKVTVKVEEAEADRGGMDKWCSIIVAPRPSHVEIAEATEANLHDVIGEAIRRIWRLTARFSKLDLARDRRDAQRPAALVRIRSPGRRFMSKQTDKTKCHACQSLLFPA